MAATYTVLSQLNHDNKSYVEGDVLSIPNESAEPLLAIGVIRPATETEAASISDDSKTKTKPAEKVGA